MWKYLKHRETLSYVDVLPDMLASYNHTVHIIIGIPPAEVTWANQTTVSKRLYGSFQNFTWSSLTKYTGGLVSIHFTTVNNSSVQLLNTTYKSTQHLLEVSFLRMAPSDTDSVSAWVTCGKKTPRSKVVFLSQVVILYTVIIVSIYQNFTVVVFD
jgi:hypothetical protein